MVRQAGELMGGRYRLLEILGEGSMGEVWLAEDERLGARVALKMVSTAILMESASTRKEALRRFRQEAELAAVLRSPHVCTLLDYGVDGGIPYHVLELLEGESLDDRLDRVGKLTPAELVTIVVHVSRALERAHASGIVHRDLKPGNVFLARNGDDEIAKVLDFGVAKRTQPGLHVKDSGGSLGTSIVGTPMYMSPEHILGMNTDSRADLWALGIIAFECMCGMVPWRSEIVTQLVVEIAKERPLVPSEVADVPEGFDAWFAKAVHPVPAMRFASAGAMADALRSCILGDVHPSMDRIVVPAQLQAAAPPSDPGAKPASSRKSATTATHSTLARSLAPLPAQSVQPRRAWWPLAVGGALVVIAALIVSMRSSEPTTRGDAPAAQASTATPAVSESAPAPQGSVPPSTASVSPSGSTSATPGASTSARSVVSRLPPQRPLGAAPRPSVAPPTPPPPKPRDARTGL